MGRDKYKENERVLDELIKKIKMKVTDFNEKFDHDTFHDWMVSLKDYFEWFSVPENRMTKFVKLKLKGVVHSW
jgi:hypothetical protein